MFHIPVGNVNVGVNRLKGIMHFLVTEERVHSGPIL